jgi:hypothetical protein
LFLLTFYNMATRKFKSDLWSYLWFVYMIFLLHSKQFSVQGVKLQAFLNFDFWMRNISSSEKCLQSNYIIPITYYLGVLMNIF